MGTSLQIEILTPAGEVTSSTASEVLLPSHKGELGILPDHEDLVGLLSTGTVKIVEDGKDFWFVVSGGAFKVENQQVTLFAEYGVRAEDIRESDIEKSLDEVRRELAVKVDTYTKENQSLAKKESLYLAMQEALRRHSMS
jgi:F-type H+-transporting ATPase subunit epsilon